MEGNRHYLRTGKEVREMRRFFKSLSMGLAMKAKWMEMVKGRLSPAVRHETMIKFMRKKF